MYKVRFNLGRGERYMKWKVTHPDKSVTYHEPSEVNILMVNCSLKNHKESAEKIYKGANKRVCAWVECENLNILNYEDLNLIGRRKVCYNPKIKPNWVLDDKNIDNQTFSVLITKDKSIYT